MCFAVNTRLYLIYFRPNSSRAFRFQTNKIFTINFVLYWFFNSIYYFRCFCIFLRQKLLQNSEILRITAGIVIIIFSLQLVGLINISYLKLEKRFEAKKSQNVLFPYVIGLAFGLVGQLVLDQF